MKPSDKHWHNKAAWDRLAKKQDRLARPAREIDFADPLASVDGPGWLGGNGGRQGPIYAAAGAKVTVVDLSPVMLELDQKVAAERKLNLRTLETSMDDLSELGDAVFDIVIHPVSTCYLQHKQPTSMQAGIEPEQGSYRLQQSYFFKQPLPASPKPNLIREEGTQEYIHRWEELIGHMCRAGLFIEDLTEPLHAKPDAAAGSFEHRSQFIAPYVRIKARKHGQAAKPSALIQV